MNLARVLDVSLPELPQVGGRERFYRFNPNIVWREREERGEKIIMAIGPETRRVFTLTPERWNLVRLFDGNRNYEQISHLFHQRYGIAASPENIQGFADLLEANGFWLRTPEEEALARMEELKARAKRTKRRSAKDLTSIEVVTIDADPQISMVQRWLSFVWTPGFVLASTVALLAMVGLWIARWDQVWRDSVVFWDMSNKTFADVLEFYAIMLIVGFVHESGHALTAKNFGAEVHKVGLLLVYTLPAFFVDTTEAIVHTNYFQRLYVILAGFWFELMLCAVATLVWWGTAAGGAVHAFAYKLILLGGIMPLIFNMNPLMRLDGYLLFCKLLRMPYLREKSTAFLTGWVRRHIFDLDVEVEVLPQRRQIFFATYAFLAGCYTYVVLLFLARITYSVVHTFSPDWAFLPATVVALAVFRGRIEKFLEFVEAVYQRHKEWIMAQRKALAVGAAVVLVFLCLPLWRESVPAPVLLEPVNRAVLRVQVPARVQDIAVREGQVVAANETVARLSALDVESEQARAASSLQAASAAVREANLEYTGYAAAAAERSTWSERARIAGEKVRELTITAPISGVVVSSRVQDLKGDFLPAGSEVAEIQDVSTLRARLFVDETDLRILRQITGDSIKLAGRFGVVHGAVEDIGSVPQDPPAGVVDLSKYKGLTPPPRYVVTVLIQNDGTMRSGMTGDAKLFGARHSALALAFRPLADFAGRKFW